MIGSIVIPAHNESTVIGRTLRGLVPLIDQGVEVIVSTNGCTDDTADVARSVPGVVVVENAVASKAGALNAADAVADSFPRMYLDADIELEARTAARVLESLYGEEFLAARPSFRYEYAGAHWMVRAFYRARSRMPAMRAHLWGAGVYVLSARGHDRLRRFPELTADDLYVDSLFERDELRIVYAEPAVVRTPLTTRTLINTLRRVHGGKAQVAEQQPVESVGGLRELLRAVHGPASLVDAIVYAAVSVVAKMRPARTGWQRDETRRQGRGAESALVPPGSLADLSTG